MSDSRRELTELAYKAAATINIEPDARDRAILEEHFREKFFECLEAGRPKPTADVVDLAGYSRAV